MIKKEHDRIYSRKYRKEHLEWKKKDNQKRKKIVLKLVKKYAKNNPEIIKAQSDFNRAIKYGKIFRKPCIICGKEKADGHHADYSKPFEVIWLCHQHHKELHFEIINLK